MITTVERQSNDYVLAQRNCISKTKWLFILFWIRYTVIYWGCVILNQIPFLINVTPIVFPILLIVALLEWLKGTNYRLDIFNIVVLFGAIVLWFVSRQIHHNYQYFFDENIWRCFEAFLMIYVGKSVFRGGINDGSYGLLVKLSRLGIALTALYFIYGAFSGRVVASEYMTISYRVLPSTLCVTSAFLKKINVRSTLWFIGAVILQVFMGTRGAVLSVAVFIILYVFLFAKRKLFFIFLACIIIFIVMDYVLNFSTLLLKFLASVCKSLNMSTRIVESILNNSIADDNGREKIYMFVINHIWDNILIGEGIFADRYILLKFPGGAPYVHNIFLELWSNFGLIPSCIIMITIFVLVFRFLICKRQSKESRLLLMIVFTASMVQLMFTGSYLTDAPFWLLIGMLWGIGKYSKLKPIKQAD